MKTLKDYHLEDFQEPGNTKPIFKAFKHALSNKNVEQFGFFAFNDTYSDYEFIPCENLNSFNPHFFSSNNHEFYRHYLDRKIISLFHTHLIDSPAPSELDKEISNSIGIPSFIFSVNSKNSFLFYPKSYKPRRLEKRIFIPYFQDCITFVKDFYNLNLNIDLSDKIGNWSRRLHHSNDAMIECINEIFLPVDLNNIQHGDLIIFKPFSFPLFHIAVCIDGMHYWHHPAGLYPSKELLSQLEENKVYKIYRYKDL